jgi:hypothetical protein
MRGVLYYTRPDVATRWSAPPAILDTLPELNNPLLTQDCGRMYFDALSSILYYQQ